MMLTQFTIFSKCPGENGKLPDLIQIPIGVNGNSLLTSIGQFQVDSLV